MVMTAPYFFFAYDWLWMSACTGRGRRRIKRKRIKRKRRERRKRMNFLNERNERDDDLSYNDTVNNDRGNYRP